MTTYTIKTIARVCQNIHNANQKIVLVTGFFDLLHEEHINFLTKAKETGDFLIVGVESDERAYAIKGEGRPVETQATRLSAIAPYSNYQIALDPNFDNPLAFETLISAVSPDILAVSSHTQHQDKKRVLVEKYGGKLVVVHDWNPSISTTEIIKSQNKL